MPLFDPKFSQESVGLCSNFFRLQRLPSMILGWHFKVIGSLEMIVVMNNKSSEKVASTVLQCHGKH